MEVKGRRRRSKIRKEGGGRREGWEGKKLKGNEIIKERDKKRTNEEENNMNDLEGEEKNNEWEEKEKLKDEKQNSKGLDRRYFMFLIVPFDILYFFFEEKKAWWWIKIENEKWDQFLEKPSFNKKTFLVIFT